MSLKFFWVVSSPFIFLFFLFDVFPSRIKKLIDFKIDSCCIIVISCDLSSTWSLLRKNWKLRNWILRLQIFAFHRHLSTVMFVRLVMLWKCRETSIVIYTRTGTKRGVHVEMKGGMLPSPPQKNIIIANIRGVKNCWLQRFQF